MTSASTTSSSDDWSPASPDGFKPLARAQILPGVVRAYPALADGLVYVRNGNTLVCLDLRK